MYTIYVGSTIFLEIRVTQMGLTLKETFLNLRIFSIILLHIQRSVNTKNFSKPFGRNVETFFCTFLIVVEHIIDEQLFEETVTLLSCFL